MRYDIDLTGRTRRWAPSLALTVELLQRIMTSTPIIVFLTGVLVLGLGYFAVFVPLFKVSPVHKTQIRDLKLLEKSIDEQRDALLREAKAALQVQGEAPGWTARILALGEDVPDGLWLSRVALDEEQPKAGRRRPTGAQAQPESAQIYLIIEGRVDTRLFPSPLEPISRYLARVREDPRIREVIGALELVNTSATKEDPMVVSFQLKGLWTPGGPAGKKPEDRIQALIQAQGPAQGAKR
jgi:hypothetical protein